MLVVFFIVVLLTFFINGDAEFVKCIADCVDLKDCYEAKIFLKENGTHPQICGFNGTEPRVCCAAEDEKTLFDIHYAGLRKTAKKCKELNPPRIYHIPKQFDLPYGCYGDGCLYAGFKVNDYEFAFMAALGYGNHESPLYRCGGFLIQSNVVITAAHCAEISGEPPSVARIGSIALLSNDSKPIEVVKVISHPNYNHQTDQNDIAIIILSEHSKENPSCLFTQRLNLRHYNRGIALGFGTETFAGRFSEDLMKTFYNIKHKSFCEKEYQGQPILDSQLCVLGERRHYKNGTSLVQDTCQGDSGGPLVVDDNHKYVVGIVSYGRRCGSEAPGIYTYVASYYDWINATIIQEGNKNGLHECIKLEPPYITMSICNGGGQIKKSCSGIANVGMKSSAFSNFMVRLGYGDINNPVYECDGVLVEKNIVITAAQCTPINGKQPVVVQFSSTITRVVKIIPHPNYQPQTYLHNIAILFLAENSGGIPACLWSSSIDLKSKNFEAYAVGYGTTSFDGMLETEFLISHVNISYNTDCLREYKMNEPLPNSLLCVLSKTDYVGDDTYQVNSGGSLFLTPHWNSPTSVVAIISYIQGNVFYTNTTTYLDWIESVIWPEGTQAERHYIT